MKQATNRRGTDRVPQRSTVKIQNWNEADPDAAYLCDISWRGVRLDAPREFKTGEILTLLLPKWKHGPARRVTARVVWCKPSNSAGWFQVGCRIAR